MLSPALEDSGYGGHASTAESVIVWHVQRLRQAPDREYIDRKYSPGDSHARTIIAVPLALVYPLSRSSALEDRDARPPRAWQRLLPHNSSKIVTQRTGIFLLAECTPAPAKVSASGPSVPHATQDSGHADPSTSLYPDTALHNPA